MNIQCLKVSLKWLKDQTFLIMIILSAILGLGFGFLIKNFWEMSPIMITYIGLPGKLVIRAFMMVLVPLIVASITTSVTDAKLGHNKKLILTALLLFIASSTFSSIFGTVLIFTTKPGVLEMRDNRSYGKNFSNINSENNLNLFSQEDTIYDLFINLIPENIISATFSQEYTALEPIDVKNLTLGYKKVSKQSLRTNFLGLCAFSLILGFAVQSLEPEAKIIKKTLKEINDIIMKIIMALMKVMPIGMFSWMCVEAIEMQSPKDELTQIAWFFGIAFIAFVIHLFILWPGIYFLILQKNPFRFYMNILPVIVVAFGSASSAFTLPVTIKCMEENNHLSKRFARIILPLGMTLHMNGFAMYYPMVTIFVAQMHGLYISLLQIISLCLFTIMMSLAMPGIPSGGSSIVTFIAHCTVVGINNPLDVLVYIMTIDWLMERIRTVTNVTGTCFVATILQKILSKNRNDTKGFQMVAINDEQKP